MVGRVLAYMACKWLMLIISIDSGLAGNKITRLVCASVLHIAGLGRGVYSLGIPNIRLSVQLHFPSGNRYVANGQGHMYA